MTDRVSDIDYATWLTKAQAAEAMGVTPKTVERFVHDGKIQHTRWQPGGRGPTRVVYHPDDVARVAAERQRGPLPPFLVPGPPVAPTNGNGHQALARVPADLTTSSLSQTGGAGEEFFRVLVAAAVRVRSETSQTSVAFLTITEASAFTGLTQAFLKRMIAQGTLTAIKDRGWKIRRKDLEAL
jgi:excisionase family DNA binding protein